MCGQVSLHEPNYNFSLETHRLIGDERECRQHKQGRCRRRRREGYAVTMRRDRPWIFSCLRLTLTDSLKDLRANRSPNVSREISEDRRSSQFRWTVLRHSATFPCRVRRYFRRRRRRRATDMCVYYVCACTCVYMCTNSKERERESERAKEGQ